MATNREGLTTTHDRPRLLGRASWRGTIGTLWLMAFMALGCSARSPEAPRATTLSVFAASSLTEAFMDLERAFERAERDIDLRLTFAGSQTLRTQIEHGAPADVFVSANFRHVRALVDAGLASTPTLLAENELVVVVPRADDEIQSFEDLPRAKRIVVGTEGVPVGGYARQVLALAERTHGREFVAAIRANIASEESNARLVRAKVSLGEADAAFVYRTDAIGSAAVRVIEIPRVFDVRPRCWVVSIELGTPPGAYLALQRFLRSPAALEILRRHGFHSPPG